MRFLTKITLAIIASNFLPAAQEARSRVVDRRTPTTAANSADSTDLTSKLADLGMAPTRQVTTDLCFPNSSEEYESIGKNAVLMLKSSSVLSTELPLRSAYLETKGLRIPLQRIAALDKTPTTVGSGAKATRYTEQVSFYLIPISLIKAGAQLKVDFTGGRTAFGVMRVNGDTLAGAPAFVRLDEYDTPTEPDMNAIHALLAREYPDYFQ